MNYRRILILAFIFVNLIVLKSLSQEIKEFYITCDQEEFDYMYENYQEEIFVPVELSFNGTIWTDVKIRIRGDSSKDYPKKSLKVVFEADSFITGRDVLNFNAEYYDKSYFHSYLSSYVFNAAGVDCVNMEHIRLYLNGNFYGLYLLTENLDESFLLSKGYEADGNLYKASIDGSCLSIFDNIFYHWDKKFGESNKRSDLNQLIKDLNYSDDDNFKVFLENNFEYDNLITFIAINMLLANGSTYYHNYFLYQKNGIWYIFPWDLDKTFSSYSEWLPYHRSSGSWTPDNPLLERSIIDSEIFEDIKDKLSDLNTTVFTEDFLFPVIDSLKTKLQSSVVEDTTDNIPDLQTWFDAIEDDKDAISNRFSLLTTQLNNVPTNFFLNRLNGYFKPNDNIIFSWEPSIDPNGDDVLYNLSISQNKLFEGETTITIEDISDTDYTINHLTNEGKYYWKVVAHANLNSITGFDSYNHFFISQDIPEVVINEINYNSNNEFDSGDWIELFNPNNEVVDLSGWIFKDENDQHQYIFPNETKIEALGFIILCRDTIKFHSKYSQSIPTIGDFNFGLKSSGELIRLYHQTEYLVDSLVYDNNEPWPIEPDGEGPTLELLHPSFNNQYGHNWKSSYEYGTPGVQNSNYIPDNINDNNKNNEKLILNYPNPFINNTTIKFLVDSPKFITIQIFDIKGHLVFETSSDNKLSGEQLYIWSGENLSPGEYLYIVLADGVVLGKGIAVKRTN